MEAAPDTVEAPPYDMEVEDIADSEVRNMMSSVLIIFFTPRSLIFISTYHFSSDSMESYLNLNL